MKKVWVLCCCCPNSRLISDCLWRDPLRSSPSRAHTGPSAAMNQTSGRRMRASPAPPRAERAPHQHWPVPPGPTGQRFWGRPCSRPCLGVGERAPVFEVIGREARGDGCDALRTADVGDGTVDGGGDGVGRRRDEEGASGCGQGEKGGEGGGRDGSRARTRRGCAARPGHECTLVTGLSGGRSGFET